ncbi:hypothetical protein ThidrDRAFT_3191 [Thiorhodococcus drewsii AZ1]|uniref:Uncharacterized protein n=1 Tax=Thiorhodococcus drewsii AZ1 TaxID=765913 RepID=G2E4H8_9GAMM|nr:hypothetical protein ThidrDRAFT_3191 [Thiorhodococcus drewsii AZ1]
MAMAALQQGARAQSHRYAAVTTARADEPLRPAPLLQGFNAQSFTAVVRHKFLQAQALLKLDRVLCHQRFSRNSRWSQYAPIQHSQAEIRK